VSNELTAIFVISTLTTSQQGHLFRNLVIIKFMRAAESAFLFKAGRYYHHVELFEVVHFQSIFIQVEFSQIVRSACVIDNEKSQID
jgi:hypothetical protein